MRRMVSWHVGMRDNVAREAIKQLAALLGFESINLRPPRCCKSVALFPSVSKCGNDWQRPLCAETCEDRMGQMAAQMQAILEFLEAELVAKDNTYVVKKRKRGEGA